MAVERVYPRTPDGKRYVWDWWVLSEGEKLRILGEETYSLYEEKGVFNYARTKFVSDCSGGDPEDIKIDRPAGRMPTDESVVVSRSVVMQEEVPLPPQVGLEIQGYLGELNGYEDWINSS